jgi:uncharacterized protein involved in exopolysaccharide biosynthesis
MPEEAGRDSPELEHYAAVLQRHWRLVLLGVAVSLAAAFAYVALAPRVYEATATVIVIHRATDDASTDPESTATARALFDSQAMAARVLREIQLEHGSVPVTPATFLRDVLRVDEVRGTSLLRVSARLPDPELAARVVNRVTEATIERNDRVTRSAESGEQKLLKAQVDQADANLRAVQQRLLAYQTESQLDLLRQERTVLLSQRAEVPRLLVDIAAERARLAKAEEELEKLGQSDPSVRAPAAYPRVPPQAARPGGERASTPLGRETADAAAQRRSEHDGSGELEVAGLALRDALLYQVTVSRSRLAGLEAERRQLVERMKPDGPGLQQLGELYQHEIAIARLELEHDVSRSVYADVARRYEQARLDAIARATGLEILEPAVVPARPVFPQPARILTIALFGGLFLSLVAIFTLAALQQGRRRSTAALAAHPDRARADAGLSAEGGAVLNLDRRNGV